MYEQALFEMPDKPALGYAGTEGASGSAASHARAEIEANDGTAYTRQRALLVLLADAGVNGLTWRELASMTGQHHGQVTGSLSNMHKANVITRLAREHERDRCSVYVLPQFVDGREVVAQGRR